MVTTCGSLVEPPRTIPADSTTPRTVETKRIPIQKRPTVPSKIAEDKRTTRLFTWAVAGVLGLIAVIGGVFLYTSTSGTEPTVATTAVHMGLSPQAWSQHRAGERASIQAPVVSP